MNTINCQTQLVDHSIDVVAKIIGGRDRLAAELQVSAAAVGNWKIRGIPAKQCVRIERLTGGQVTRKDMRPDDYWEIWPDLAESTENTAQTAMQSVANVN